jgi:hypothetical protein
LSKACSNFSRYESLARASPHYRSLETAA